MQFTAFGLTDIGRSRQKNDDAFLLDANLKVFAVADGLGGLPGGDLASQTAVASILEDAKGKRIESLLDMHQAVRSANSAVYREGDKVSEEVGIGTTLTTMMVREKDIIFAHVGDTSLYLFRRGALRKLTKEHTMAQEVRDSLRPGEETFIPEYFAHTLTRCLGQKEQVEVDLGHQAINEGDRLFLCSDGVDKVFEIAEIEDSLAEATKPEPLIRSLIEEGNIRGGPDNITAIAIFFA